MDHQVLYDTVSMTFGDVSVSFNYTSVTNHAMAHNRLPVLHTIVAEHLGQPDLDGRVAEPSPSLHARVFAIVDGSVVFDTEAIYIRSLGANRSVSIECYDKSRVPESLTSNASEAMRGDIYFLLTTSVATQELTPEELTKTVVNDEVQRVSKDFRVLAANEWFNAAPYYASLAAYVQPNSGEIVSLNRQVSDILNRRTQGSAINGYQDGSERAIAIAGAVYEALRNLDLRYVTSPPSFERSAQRIRSSAQVISGRAGTCIDFSIAFCALAEHCGLHPIIFLVEGHAFTGIQLRDERLPESVLVDSSTIKNLVTAGSIMPIEAGIYEDSAFPTLLSAVTRAKELVSNNEILGAIGVRSCHEDNIRPLPSYSEEFNSAKQIGVGSNEQHSSPWELPVYEEKSVDASTVFLRRVDNSPERVKNWKAALLDLTMRNRLLNMRQSKEVLQLHIPTAEVLSSLDDLVHARKSLSLRPFRHVSENRKLQGYASIVDFEPEYVLEELLERDRIYVDLSLGSYRSVLRNLRRTATRNLEETGVSNLYLTLGAIAHSTPSGVRALAPLFLVPISLIGGEGDSEFRMVLDSTSIATVNYSLVEWLKVKHNLRISALDEAKTDESGLDMNYALSEVAAALIRARLPFSVEEDARIVIAKFSTYEMWRDLELHWETFMESPVFEHLTLNPGSTFTDPAGDTPIESIEVDESSLALPIPADGAQLAAISAAGRGRSFVLEGPPGTGKSQTITNMIAHCLDEGKSVLFVAEKQAALEVVQKRLDAAGLGLFTLDLHGKDIGLDSIKHKLKSALEFSLSYELTTWEALKAGVKTRIEPLAAYPMKIHGRNRFNHSLWSSYSLLKRVEAVESTDIPVSFISRPPMDRAKFDNLVESVSQGINQIDFSRVRRWALAGDEVSPDLVQGFASFELAYRSLECNFSSVRGFHDLVDHFFRNPNVLKRLLALDRSWLLSSADLVRYQTAPEAIRQAVSGIAAYKSEYDAAAKVFSEAFIFHGELGPLNDAISALRQSLLWKRRKQNAYRDLLRSVVPYGVEPDLEGLHDPRSVRTWLGRISLIREMMKEHAKLLSGMAGVDGIVTSSRNPNELIAELLHRSDLIREAITLASHHPDDVAVVRQASESIPSDLLLVSLTELETSWRKFCEGLGATLDTIARWQDGRTWTEAIDASLEHWRKDLDFGGISVPLAATRWNAIAGKLHSLGLYATAKQIEEGALTSQNFDLAVKKGIADTSLNERFDQSGVGFVTASSKDIEIRRLSEAMSDLRKQSRYALPKRLLNRRSFSPRRIEGRFGRLKAELKVKRNAKSFRQLFTEYPDEILELTPCILVSPATLAAHIAPGSTKFDVVIFDEASQIPVDQAMGAIGRAESVIIAGDSKQMPPTRFGQSFRDYDAESWDEESDGLSGIDDLESILSEAVESGIEQVWLEWHYRSRDEALIAFSNMSYYEGRLHSLPSPRFKVTAAVELRRINGQFIREKGRFLRTNPTEAAAIVDEIHRLVNDESNLDASIGVVTFNANQRDLILDLLEESKDPGVHELMTRNVDPIFVKNLENVQGDERDIILFSTAFSKHADGRSMPMNFGPLSRRGGERRLNVAITRARQKVILFSSFDPEEIDLQRTSSQGLRDLRAYLLFARSNSLISNAEGQRLQAGENIVRDEVAEELRKRGFIVEADYGMSSYTLDLVARKEQCLHWQVAIMTDSEKWRNLRTVVDRDVTPSLLRTIMQWPAVIRIWLPEWIHDRDSVVERIVEAAAECDCAIQAVTEIEQSVSTSENKGLENRSKASGSVKISSKGIDEVQSCPAEGDEIRLGTAAISGDVDEGSACAKVDRFGAAEVSGNNPADQEPDGAQSLAELKAREEAAKEHAEAVYREGFEMQLQMEEARQKRRHRQVAPELRSAKKKHTALAGAISPPYRKAVSQVGGRILDLSYLKSAKWEAPRLDHSGRAGDLEDPITSYTRSLLRSEVSKLVERSGPLLFSDVASTVRKAFGHSRRTAAFDGIVKESLRGTLITREKHGGAEVVWPQSLDPASYHEFRLNSTRAIRQIPLKELENYVLSLGSADPYGLLREIDQRTDSLSRKVLKAFGGGNLTEPQSRRIRAAIEAARRTLRKELGA